MDANATMKLQRGSDWAYWNFLSMEPNVLAGNLQNADIMSAALGVQFFAALALVAYGVVIAHR